MANQLTSCLSCDTSTDDGRHALQCDVCNRWAHINCVGVSLQAYKLGGKLEGFQWFCPKCLANWGLMQPSMLKLESELEGLKTEALKVPALEQTIVELQLTIKKLSSTLDFLTASDGLAGTTQSSPPHIPTSPNRFELLKTLDDNVEQQFCFPDSPNSQTQFAPDSIYSNGFPLTEHQIQLSSSSPASNPSPRYQPHGMNPCSQNSKASSPKQRKVETFLRNVPSQLSTREVQTKLVKAGISLSGCEITSDLDSSSPPRAHVKLTFDTLDRCNALDKSLRLCPSLPWFLSLFPPRNPKPRHLNHVGPKKQAAQTLTRKTPFFQKGAKKEPPNPSQISPSQIPALMSLKLPPFPAHSILTPNLVEHSIHNPTAWRHQSLPQSNYAS